MKNKNIRLGVRSQVALAATLMSVPTLGGAQEPATKGPKLEESPAASHVASRSATATKQKSALKFADKFQKLAGPVTIAGSEKGHTIYKDGAGKYFRIDPATGDQKFVSATRNKGTQPDKRVSEVTLVGEDAEGHVIHQNARGEQFYLSPTTGDMVLVK